MSGGYLGKFWQKQCNIQLSRNNLGEQMILESDIIRLSESLTSKILPTMGPTPEYTGFTE